MKEHTEDLATLIGSRICHDLISPIGAISNGLELLDLTGAASGPELSLISESAENAGARIRFFRIAFGAAGDQMLGRADVVAVLGDNFHGSRFEILWTHDTDTSRADVRLAFLAIMCVETALPHGGRISISAIGGKWTVTGRSDKISTDSALWQMFEPGAPHQKATPATVQFALLSRCAKDAKRTVECHRQDSEISLVF